MKSIPQILKTRNSLIPEAVKMGTRMKTALPLALALACAACTPMQWVKEDAGAAQIRKDLDECGREAWLHAWDRTLYYGAPPAVMIRDAQGRTAILHPYGPFSDPFVLESRHADFCMRQRGYRLEPVRDGK